MTGPDEYDQLVARKFKPYSKPHIQLYKTIAELLNDQPAKVLEVGSGIFAGLDCLLDNNCLSRYIGIEPSKKCCDYFYKVHHINIFDIKCVNEEFMKVKDLPKDNDFSLCIEVIEHVENISLFRWFSKMREHTKIASFISTPDKCVSDHGAFTKEQVEKYLIKAGYSSVVSIEWQMPHTLFIAKV